MQRRTQEDSGFIFGSLDYIVDLGYFVVLLTPKYVIIFIFPYDWKIYKDYFEKQLHVISSFGEITSLWFNDKSSRERLGEAAFNAQFCQ